MIKLRFWPSNLNYIDSNCPWCDEQSMYMGEVVCLDCNKILPNIELLPTDAKERLNFHTEASKGYLT